MKTLSTLERLNLVETDWEQVSDYVIQTALIDISLARCISFHFVSEPGKVKKQNKAVLTLEVSNFIDSSYSSNFNTKQYYTDSTLTAIVFYSLIPVPFKYGRFKISAGATTVGSEILIGKHNCVLFSK